MNKEIEKTRIDKITALHSEIGGYLKTTITKAIEIGGLLSEQKAELEHGQWLPWVKENLPFSERLTRDYLRFYDNRDKLKTASLADLTDARRFLSEPKQITFSDRREELLKKQEEARERATQAAIENLELMKEIAEYDRDLAQLERLACKSVELHERAEALIEATDRGVSIMQDEGYDTYKKLNVEWRQLFKDLYSLRGTFPEMESYKTDFKNDLKNLKPMSEEELEDIFQKVISGEDISGLLV